MSRPLPFVIACWLGGLGLAQADIVHLKNGRTMEGEVTRQTPDAIHLQVRGGSMVLPRSAIDRVEEKQRPQDAFAARLRRVDATDPEALDELALWASSRGLGQESKNLTAQANGIRLQQRVDAIRGSQRVRDWIEVYHWAQHRQLSDEVQRWLLAQAEAIDPEHLSVRLAQREREHVEALAEFEAEQELEEAALTGYAAREARARRRLEEKAEQAEAERIARLEAQLEAQQARIDELERRPSRRIIRRRRTPRYGVSVGIILPPGTNGPIRACPTPPPSEPELDPNPVSIRGR